MQVRMGLRLARRSSDRTRAVTRWKGELEARERDDEEEGRQEEELLMAKTPTDNPLPKNSRYHITATLPHHTTKCNTARGRRTPPNCASSAPPPIHGRHNPDLITEPNPTT